MTEKDIINLRTYLKRIFKEEAVVTELIFVYVSEQLIIHLGIDLIEAARRALHMRNAVTIGNEEIKTAVQLVFPKGLRSKILEQIDSSVSSYQESVSGGGAQRSGLVIPPARIEKLIRYQLGKFRVSKTASVALAAVLEAVCRELISLSRSQLPPRKKRITEYELDEAVRKDPSYRELLKHHIIAAGVVV